MAVFRYPGGKQSLRKTIVAILDLKRGTEYREPFVGGGSIASEVVSRGLTDRLWINDLDIGIAAFWSSVMCHLSPLLQMAKEFTPSIPAFQQFRAELHGTKQPPTNPEEVVRLGFMKLAIHRMSFSGLGEMAGGPLGGKTPKDPNAIKSRWNPDALCREIASLANRFQHMAIREARCTSLDFEQLILDDVQRAVLYLDPPYVGAGPQLYKHAFSEADHVRLADALRHCPHPFLLSYDNALVIRQLYSWAEIRTIPVRCTIQQANAGPEKTTVVKDELLIVPRDKLVHCLWRPKNDAGHVAPVQGTAISSEIRLA